jgi:hypothetical protein
MAILGFIRIYRRCKHGRAKLLRVARAYLLKDAEKKRPRDLSSDLACLRLRNFAKGDFGAEKKDDRQQMDRRNNSLTDEKLFLRCMKRTASGHEEIPYYLQTSIGVANFPVRMYWHDRCCLMT